MASIRSSFKRSLLGTTLGTTLRATLGAALLLGMMVSLAGCGQRGDPRYVRDGKQFGVTNGLFRARWWNYYERGLSFLDGKFHEEAIRDFRAAIKLRTDDHRQARTYGLHFTDYFPHRELGVSLLAAGQAEEAQKELLASLKHEPSAKAKFFLNNVRATLLAKAKNDREKPRIAITSIKDGMITNKFAIDVKGEATDDTYVKWVRVNGRKQFIELAEPTMPFSRKILLKPGLNKIEVAAGDLVDNTGSQTITVILDRQGPLFALRSPDDEEVVQERTITLSGRFSDASGVVEVSVNGQRIPISPGRHVDISTRITLKPGPNVVAFEARDRAGNVSGGQIEVTFSRKAGRDDWRRGWKKAEGFSPGYDAMAGGVRLASLDVLSDVPRPLLTARRGAASPRFLRIAAKPDTKPPRITIKGLKRTINEIEVFADSLFIDGKVKDRGGVANVIINDEEVSDEEGKTIFFNYLVELEEGENEVVITAEDAAGNAAKRTLKVTRKVPSVEQVGSRFTVAVLPFQLKGDADVADIIPDLFQQKLLDLERFNLVSRENEAFEAALRELKLSQTGLVSKSAAVKVGRIIQAEGIIKGTVREKENSLEVFVQIIDTETSKILAIHDVFGQEKSLDNVEFLMGGLALKLQRSFPLLEGLVVKVEGDEVILDIGRQHRVRPEMRFIIFRDGAPLKHPISGKMMAGEPLELGLLRVTKVLKDSLVGKLANAAAADKIKQLDKAITK